MEGVLPRRMLKALGLAAALLVLAGLLSFAPYDPTLTNLRYPARGIGNWLGYPGALVFGSLVELFGTASLLLPLLILNWAFNAHRPPASVYLGYGLCAVLLLSAALGLTASAPGLGWHDAGSTHRVFWHPGLLGWGAARWLWDTLGLRPGAAMLAGALGYALLRLADAPRFTDLATQGWQALRRMGWRGLGSAVAWTPVAAWNRRELVAPLLLLALRGLGVLLGAVTAGLAHISAAAAQSLGAAWQSLRPGRPDVPPALGLAHWGQRMLMRWRASRRLNRLRHGIGGTGDGTAPDSGRRMALGAQGFSSAERIARWEQLLRQHPDRNEPPEDRDNSPHAQPP